jgi:hypothetical protein
VSYRDDEQALRARIESLEDKLRERDSALAENQDLRRRIAELQAQIQVQPSAEPDRVHSPGHVERWLATPETESIFSSGADAQAARVDEDWNVLLRNLGTQAELPLGAMPTQAKGEIELPFGAVWMAESADRTAALWLPEAQRRLDHRGMLKRVVLIIVLELLLVAAVAACIGGYAWSLLVYGGPALAASVLVAWMLRRLWDRKNTRSG